MYVCNIFKLDHTENNLNGFNGCMVLLPREYLPVLTLVSHAFSPSIKEMPLQFSLQDSSWQHEIGKASVILKHELNIY